MTADPPPGRPTPAANRRQETLRPIPFEPDAEQLYEEYTAEFAAVLFLTATERAQDLNARTVTRLDVRAARDGVYEDYRRTSPPQLGKYFALLLSGAILGAGVQGFITELLGQRSPNTLVIFALITLVGILLGRLSVR